MGRQVLIFKRNEAGRLARLAYPQLEAEWGGQVGTARLSSSYMGRQVLSLNLNEAGARPVSLLILKLYWAPRCLSST